jgi:hypothetical protein
MHSLFFIVLFSIAYVMPNFKPYLGFMVIVIYRTGLHDGGKNFSSPQMKEQGQAALHGVGSNPVFLVRGKRAYFPEK